MMNNVFEDTMQGLQEALAHARGEIQLRTHTVAIDDEDLELHQLISFKMSELSKSNKQRVVGYVDGLLQAQTG